MNSDYCPILMNKRVYIEAAGTSGSFFPQCLLIQLDGRLRWHRHTLYRKAAS